MVPFENWWGGRSAMCAAVRTTERISKQAPSWVHLRRAVIGHLAVEAMDAVELGFGCPLAAESLEREYLSLGGRANDATPLDVRVAVFGD